MKAWHKEKTAWQEAAETCLESKEPTSLERESEVEHEEIPKEEGCSGNVWSSEGAV
jgi:hypothetical protein